MVYVGQAYQKSWTLDAWSGCLDSRCQDAWTLDTCTLDAWIFGFWKPGLWTLGPRKFYPVLVTSASFLLLFTVEFLSISNAL